MATTYYADIQKLYVAYFNRPADSGGLQFWESVLEGNGGNTAVIAAEFAKSAEYTAAYGSKTAYQAVAAIYQNLFGREADVAGLNFWAQHLIAGDYTIDQAVTIIASAAQGDDAKVIANRVTAATAFTNALDTTAEIIGYSGAKANAEAVKFLSGIGADEAKLAAAIAPANLDKTVNTVVGIGSQESGKVFTLTTGVDTIVGTSGNDSIVGTVSGDGTITSGATFTALDRIDGGAGYDTFTITNTGANAGFTTFIDNTGLVIPSTSQVTNVEAAVLRNASGRVDANLSNWEGLQTVSVDQRVDRDVTITTNGNATSVSVTGGEYIEVTDASDDDTLTTVSLNGSTDGAAVYSDVLANLSVSNTDESTYVEAAAGIRALNVAVNNVTDYAWIQDDTATTVNVSATGAASEITLSAQSATALTFAGDQELTVSTGPGDLNRGSIGSYIENVKSIVSTNSAGLTLVTKLATDVSFTGGDGDDSVIIGATTKAIAMGAGDDTVFVTSALGAGGSIAGGEGTNTLAFASAAVAAELSANNTFSKSVDGFQKVSIGAVGTNASATINLANLDNIDYVVSAGTDVAGVAETNAFETPVVAAGTSITIAGVTVKATQGDLAAADVAKALSGQAVTGALVSGSLSANWTAAVSATSPTTVVYTSVQSGDVANLVASTAGVAKPVFSANTTQGTSTSVETTVITLNDLKAGQSVTLNGITVKALADVSAAEVATAYLNGGVDNPKVAYSYDLNFYVSAWGNRVAGTESNQVQLSYTGNGNAPDVVLTSAGNAGAIAPTVSEAAGTPGSALTIANMASGGTFELTDAINGTVTIAVTDASLSGADVLNIKLNGASNIVSTGTLNVAGVETLNITTADSTASANPTAASALKIVDAAATTIVISGNHGIDLSGSSLAGVTTLDASGIVASGSATAAGTTGKVTFTSQVTDKALTVSTGNGADVIDLSSNTKGATVSTGAGTDTIWGTSGTDTIDAGAGRDTVYSSAGGDTITLGAGNDVFVLQTAAHSTLAKSTTITDFSANTKAGGTSAAAIAAGATGTVADLTGDTISLSLLSGTGIAVLVVNSAADAQTFLQNTATNTAYDGIALDATTGKLYIDLDHNGTADSVITLTGVTTITEAAFVVGHFAPPP